MFRCLFWKSTVQRRLAALAVTLGHWRGERLAVGLQLTGCSADVLPQAQDVAVAMASGVAHQSGRIMPRFSLSASSTIPTARQVRRF